MINFDHPNYSGIALKPEEIGDYIHNSTFKVDQSKDEFLIDLCNHIKEEEYWPRFMIYRDDPHFFQNTASERVAYHWTYIDWCRDLSITDVLKNLGPTDFFFNSVWRLDFGGVLYVFWKEHQGYGDMDIKVQTMSKAVWNERYAIDWSLK